MPNKTTREELLKKYEDLWYTENGFAREDFPDLEEEVWSFIEEALETAKREAVEEVLRKLDIAHATLWNSSEGIESKEWCEGCMAERRIVIEAINQLLKQP